MADDTYMQRGKSQVLFNYLPGNSFDYTGQDSIHIVKEIDANVRTDLNEDYLGSRILNYVEKWKRGNGHGVSGFPSKYIDNFQFLQPREVGTSIFPLLFRCTTCERVHTYSSVEALSKYNPKLKCKNKENCPGEIQQHQFVYIHECGNIKTPRPGQCSQCNSYDDWTFESYGSQRFRNAEWLCKACGNTKDLDTDGWCNSCNLPKSSMQLTVHRASSAYQIHHISVIDISADINTDASRPQFSQAVAARFLGITDEPIEDIDLKHEDTRERREALEFQLSQYREMFGESGAETIKQQIEEKERELEDLEAQSSSLAEQVTAKVPVLDVDPLDTDDTIPEYIQTAIYDAYQFLRMDRELDRQTAKDVIVSSGADTPESRTRREYRAKNVKSRMERLGLDDVAFIEDFPITNAVFGYTRINREPDDSHLRAFGAEEVDSSGDGIPVFADTVKTEAVQFTLQPKSVLRWLLMNAHDEDELNSRLLDAIFESEIPSDRKIPRLSAWGLEETQRWLEDHPYDPADTEPLSNWDRADFRAWLLSNLGEIPEIEQMELDENSDSEDVIAYVIYHLVHSYSHLVLKQVSHLSGISRTSLAEHLLPHSLSFILYSNQRTDFNIGAMFTLVESSLDDLMTEVEQRGNDCVYDPVCQREGAACHNCLFVSEVSCDHLNRNLGRDFVFGSKAVADRSLTGYFRAVQIDE